MNSGKCIPQTNVVMCVRACVRARVVHVRLNVFVCAGGGCKTSGPSRLAHRLLSLSNPMFFVCFFATATFLFKKMFLTTDINETRGWNMLNLLFATYEQPTDSYLIQPTCLLFN